MHMELASSHSFFRVPLIIPQRCKASYSNEKISIPVNPATKYIKQASNYFLLPKFSSNKLIPPAGLYGKSKFSISSICNQHMRNSIKASAQGESAGSDTITVESQDESVDLDPILSKVSRFGFACFNFTRPVALLHAMLVAISLFARVLIENPQLFKWSLLLKAFPGLLAIMFMNAYGVGINQIFDLEIDRVNKPFLSLVVGDLSLKQAWFLVIFDILAGLLIVRLMNADLITTSLYCLGFFLATFYSAPPLRFKGSSIATVIVLPLTAGIIHNVGILYATRSSLGLPFWWSPSIVFITAFTTLHFVAVSILKDLTDIEGDMKNNIRTFAAIYGPRTIAFVGTGIQLVNFIGAVGAAIYMPQLRKLDKANYTMEQNTNFYVSLWKLNILEFLLFPFM